MSHPSSALQPIHRVRWLTWLAMLLMTVGLATPSFASPVAAQSASLPDHVLQASVRIQIVIEITPADRDKEPFLCEHPEGGVLEYSNGSGTIISEDGYILTNHHVASEGSLPSDFEQFCQDQGERGDDVVLRYLAWTPDDAGRPETAYRVELIQDSSMADDLALLRITEHADGSRVNTRRNPFPFVQFGDSDLLREPEKITMIGYPLNAGVNRRVSEGIFSGRGDNGYGIEWIYTDATISGGNSGGTAVNSQGLFIGIPSAMTQDDCRSGDTNRDGTIDDRDGCIGSGGNYALLIPSNIAREFAEDATGLTFEVVESQAPSTPEAEPTDAPVDPATPLIENIQFHGADDDGNVIEDMTDLRRLEACFDSTIPGGSVLEVSWFLNGSLYFTTSLEWQDAFNPNGCVSIFLTDEATIPFLEPGVYWAQIAVNGQTFTSDEVEVFRSESTTHVESMTISGRTTDRETIEAEDGVLEGEFSSLTVQLEFAGMSPGTTWQVELQQNGNVVAASDTEVWDGSESSVESVRLRPEAREPFEPGSYEVVVLIDGVEASRTPLEITG